MWARGKEVRTNEVYIVIPTLAFSVADLAFSKSLVGLSNLLSSARILVCSKYTNILGIQGSDFSLAQQLNFARLRQQAKGKLFKNTHSLSLFLLSLFSQCTLQIILLSISWDSVFVTNVFEINIKKVKGRGRPIFLYFLSYRRRKKRCNQADSMTELDKHQS